MAPGSNDDAPTYRPRHPERTALYQLFEREGEAYRQCHEERFEPMDGPLRNEAAAAIDAFLECGRFQNGFVRIRCPACGAEHLLAFSCRIRNLCPSCQMKRAALLAECLVESVLLPIQHVHVVFTIPRSLRGLMQRDRKLLGLLSREAYRALSQEVVGDDAKDARVGMVASIQSFGEEANWHPHIHALVTAAVVRPGGRVTSKRIRAGRIHDRFRKGLISALVKAERLSPEFAETLLGWAHSGFSVFVGDPVDADDTRAQARIARYIVRPVVGAGRVSRKPNGAVLIRTTSPDRANVELDPLEAIHRLLLHVPAKGQHQVRYYGAYACRLRSRYRETPDDVSASDVPVDPAPAFVDPDDPSEVARRRSWARMLQRIFEVDPLTCARCGETMQIIGFVTQPAVIDRILRHRREKRLTSPFESRAPPAA